MTKRLFTLAGFTAIAGTVMASAGGCSGGTVFILPEGGLTLPDTGTVDSGPEDDADPDATVIPETSTTDVIAKPDAKKDSGPGGLCPNPDEIDATALPYQPPRVLPGSCSAADLNAFVTYVDGHDDPSTWKTSIANLTCRACVFGPESGGTWAPLLEDAAGAMSRLNVGGCIAIASGVDACGKSYQQWRDCYLEACSDCPDGDSNAFSKCVTSANKTACKKALDAVVPACGSVDVAADAETACDGDKYVFEGPFRAHCIGLGGG